MGSLRFAVPAVAALTLCLPSATADLIIDDYSVNFGGTGLDISAGAAGASTSVTDMGISLAGTVGDRTAMLTLTDVIDALPIGDIDMQTLTLASDITGSEGQLIPAGNYLNSNSGLGTNGFEIVLSYDLPSTDLAAHGDAFAFLFASGDFDVDNRPGNPAFLPFEIEVTSGTGTNSASVLVSQEGEYTIDFSSFAGVDFSDVTNITMTFGGEVLTPDWIMGTVSVVPSPGAFALLALAGVMAVRNRSRD